MSIPQAKMELRPLGNTGLKVSSIGFGASPLGSVFGPVAEVDAVATVSEAFRQGINFFDTSPYYGGTLSEKMLGKEIKTLQVPRSDYIVATKCGRYEQGFDFSAERVTKSIDESLERLQLDYVDILHCHDIEFGSLDQIVSENRSIINSLLASRLISKKQGLFLSQSTYAREINDRANMKGCKPISTPVDVKSKLSAEHG